MKARSRIIVAATACLLFAGTEGLAQQTPQNTTTPAQNGVIGNPQLKDFTLNGTVTRKAPAPTPRPTAPQPRQPTSNTAISPVPKATRPSRSSSAGSPAVAAPRDRSPPSQSTVIADLPAPTSTPDVSALDSTSPLPRPVTPEAADTAPAGSSGAFPMLAWIVAALALGGAGAWFFVSRRQPRESLAGAGSIDLFDATPSPAPPPAAPPASPRAQPAAPEPVPGGIVSTRLRPWLEIHFNPDRGVVDEQKAAVAFEVSVYNSGSVPARNVLLEAALLNAGPMQDQQIQLFFNNPVAKGDRIPVIPPLQSVSVNTAVFLARDQVKPIEMEGRTFFVPIVAFNALYGWGSSKGQTSACYIVGKDTGAQKLAPFRVDLGRRIFRGLAAREHELRLRK